jgi:hypothetical protein
MSGNMNAYSDHYALLKFQQIVLFLESGLSII